MMNILISIIMGVISQAQTTQVTQYVDIEDLKEKYELEDIKLTGKYFTIRDHKTGEYTDAGVYSYVNDKIDMLVIDDDNFLNWALETKDEDIYNVDQKKVLKGLFNLSGWNSDIEEVTEIISYSDKGDYMYVKFSFISEVDGNEHTMTGQINKENIMLIEK